MPAVQNSSILWTLTVALALAATIQWTVNILKYIWSNPKHRRIRILVAVLSIFFALANGITIFSHVGITFTFPWLAFPWLPLFGEIFGMVLTGLFLSRGVNFLYDRLKEFFGIQKKAEELLQQPPLDPPGNSP